MQNLKFLQERFPFLTLFRYGNIEGVGIIQNSSKHIVSIYVYDNIVSQEERKLFLELGEQWWWESNRSIAINLFLKQDFDRFGICLKNYAAKEFKVIQGPMISLSNLNQKRVKRKRIELIKQIH